MGHQCDWCKNEALHFYNEFMLTYTYVVNKSYGALCDDCMNKSMEEYSFYTIPYERWVIESVFQS